MEENPFTIESFGYLYIKCFIVALNDFAFLRFLSETPKSSRNLVRTAGYTIFARSVYALPQLSFDTVESFVFVWRGLLTMIIIPVHLTCRPQEIKLQKKNRTVLLIFFNIFGGVFSP